MTSMICMIPHPEDATSLYRGAGPMHTLKRQYGDIDLGINTTINWPLLKAADFVFFQRPNLDGAVQAMHLCKANSKPIWVDYDDNLHAIPMCNRRYGTYGHPQIQHNIASMVAMADVVTASTPHLAQSLAKLLKNFPEKEEYKLDPAKIIAIPNAYDPELHPVMKETREPRQKLVVWRGSDSHCKDLLVHTLAMVRVMGANQDWKYEFIGEPFWLTIEQLKNVLKPSSLSVTSAMDAVAFFRYLHKIRPELMIVPLEDIPFNRSKSNIAWIEATAAGAVILAPKWEEWDRPGVITYEGIDDFQAKFASFLRGEFDTETLWRQSRDYIQENLRLEKANAVRYQILCNLHPGRREVVRAV